MNHAPRPNGYRDAWAGDLRAGDARRTVRVSGWVHRRRDHGGLIFIDLRDRSGIVQLVFHPETSGPAFTAAERLRSEHVISAHGEVVRREAGNENPNIPTGEIEISVSEMQTLAEADTPPFPVDEEVPVDETLRLRHRAVDLRRESMRDALVLRHRVVKTMRDVLADRDFLEIETPVLTRSTPEGARDFLVPARLQPGAWYALPQSPQLFKQLLMMSGFERYYQIARCFRDEDLRADRQPEFTQLDLEFAFVEEHDVQDFVEGLIRHVFKEVADVELAATFPRMTYAEAMRRFGSDKPDLRIALELVDVANALKGVEFKVFAEPANDPAGRVAALRVPAAATLSRKEIDGLTEYVAKYGARGLAWIKVEDRAKGREGVSSPVAKFLDDAALEAVLAATGAQTGDIVFVGAGKWKAVTDFMGALRLKVGKDRGLVEAGWKPLWVTDFPMFEYDDE
ncbi:MAG TPA: aspartate--tRNA ligase, partial [Baekduia sp.]|nr:aspartate--tRNA ligase [Baekduia sp.]